MSNYLRREKGKGCKKGRGQVGRDEGKEREEREGVKEGDPLCIFKSFLE